MKSNKTMGKEEEEQAALTIIINTAGSSIFCKWISNVFKSSSFFFFLFLDRDNSSVSFSNDDYLKLKRGFNWRVRLATYDFMSFEDNCKYCTKPLVWDADTSFHCSYRFIPNGCLHLWASYWTRTRKVKNVEMFGIFFRVFSLYKRIIVIYIYVVCSCS